MGTKGAALAIGNNRSVPLSTEREYIDALIASDRPISDAGFTTRQATWAKTSALRINGLSVVAAAGSPIHVATREDPQYTLIVPISGIGILNGSKTIVQLTPGKVIRSSYQSNFLMHYQDYSICVIRPNIDTLIEFMRIEKRDANYAKSRLFDAPTEVVMSAFKEIEPSRFFTSIFKILDAAEGNADQLERIGIDSLITRVIAEMTLDLHPELLKLAGPRIDANKTDVSN